MVGGLDGQDAVGADDRDLIGQEAVQRRRDDRQRAAGVGHRRAQLPVDAVRVLLAERGERLVRSEQRRDEGEGVDAEVEQRSAGKDGVEHAVTVGERLAVLGVDRRDLSESPELDHLADDIPLGQEHRPERLSAIEPGLLGRGRELAGLRRAEPDRLLHEHVLAGSEAQERVLEVGGMRRRDVHDVDVVELRQLLVAAHRRRDAVAAGEVLRPRERPRSDGDDFLAGVSLQRLDELLGDPARTHDAPSQRRCLHRVRRARAGQARQDP